MRSVVQTKFILEMGSTSEMVGVALDVKPDYVTLVPEKREERTTEGGLAVTTDMDGLRAAAQALHETGILVSLFIDPNREEIEASKEIGADIVELHTGDYCNALSIDREHELKRIIVAAQIADELGLKVAAGHGLHYHNVREIAEIDEIVELNIGHSIISRVSPSKANTSS